MYCFLIIHKMTSWAVDWRPLVYMKQHIVATQIATTVHEVLHYSTPIGTLTSLEHEV